jgi:hypothetical protein
MTRPKLIKKSLKAKHFENNIIRVLKYENKNIVINSNKEALLEAYKNFTSISSYNSFDRREIQIRPVFSM